MGVLGFCLWAEWLRKILGGLIDCRRRRSWVLFFFLLAEIGANLGFFLENENADIERMAFFWKMKMQIF
jgi:hypothetical protein